ncbi:hypothetical protein PsYK624_119550 [Phanerochaete sordida]|uniref:PARP catalytic domain-containing protein n=1 Tax=Phanerochaete sordida TaxID=48140 RepID=A0A9P3GIW9_9APHY|nr:hypothetical protein PsYK624_119550 [Phanerochaete sordida]
MSQSHSIQASPSSPLCKNCHTAPVHVEASGRVHDFCGRRCAAAFGPSAPAAHGPSYYSPGGEMCLLCGDDPKHEINGRMTDFCSVSCRDDVYESAPALLEIPDSYEEFEEIAQLFRDKWLHEVTPEKPRPRQVLKIYKVYSKRSHMKKFLAYKKAKGNARRRWHGTTRKCVLGDESSMTGFCGQSDCAVCGILQNSFRVSKAKPTRALVANGSFQRFGVGIYTSATSSKSYDYIKELGGSPYMAMILSEVVMGKACKVKYEDHNLTSAPSGYDSVVGEPKLTVNYDEAVVYTDEAIRPEYLVIFEPGT